MMNEWGLQKYQEGVGVLQFNQDKFIARSINFI